MDHEDRRALASLALGFGIVALMVFLPIVFWISFSDAMSKSGFH